MKYPVYSVRDVHVGFNSPIVEVNDQTAERSFAQAVNSGGGLIYFAPKDYDLYRIGEFDTETGSLIPGNVPILICNGLSVYGAEVK